MRAPSVSRTPPRALLLTEGAPRYRGLGASESQ